MAERSIFWWFLRVCYPFGKGGELRPALARHLVAGRPVTASPMPRSDEVAGWLCPRPANNGHRGCRVGLPECRVSPRETRRVRPMPPGTRGMATTFFVPRPPCGRSGDSTTHQPSPTAPTNGWTGCRMPLQILSAGSGIHPLRHYDNPYGLYPYRGLPAFA